MKKLFFSFTLLASTFGVFAQTEPTVPSAIVDPNAPVMTFEKDAIDYGTIKQDAEGNRTFVFTNTGKSPLTISEAHGSCGCTVPSYSKEPVMPGQKSEIKVHYDTHRVGPFSKSVTINSNAKNSPSVIRISGTVEAPAVTTTGTEPSTIIPTPVSTPAAVATTSTPIVKSTTKATTTTKKTVSTTKTATKKPASTAKKTATTAKKTTTKSKSEAK
jgi:hypothetical protein